MSDSRNQPAGGARRAPKAIGCCILLPIVVGLSLFAAYKIDNLDPHIVVPTHSMPADNARDYFHRAYLATKLMKHKSPYDMVGNPAQNNTQANFQGCAIDAEPALKIMRQGLKHPYMNPAARSANTTFPMYAECRELARVNAGAADYHAISGDPGGAMQMRLDGLEMGAVMPKGGVLISGLVGLACEAIAMSRIEPLIPRLSSTELADAAVRLDQISSTQVPYADIVTEEGYAQTANVLESLHDPKTKANPFQAALDMLGGNFEDDSTNWRLRASANMAALKFTLQNKSVILRENADWHTAMAAEARGVYTGPSRVPIPDNLIAEMTGRVFDQARVKWVGMDSAISLLRVEVALYRFKKDHGMFPSMLSELAPKYLRAIPNDPCGGKPLRYIVQQDGSGFLFYSMGPDLKDNGGTPAKTLGDQPGDIVAGKLWNKKPILYSGTDQ